jgi:hypothetical protein
MNQAAEVLLIIVSSVLAVFLVVLIIIGIKFIQVMNGLKRLMKQAEKIADSAEAVGEFFRKSSGPASVVKTLANIVESALKHKRKEEK